MQIHTLVAALLVATCPLAAQMSGTYLINPTLPLSAVTFPSFADATAALAAQGVSGPVEFLIYDDAGPYNESNPFVTINGTYGTSDAVLVMTSWTGTSPSNRVTFRPAPGERVVIDATGRAMGVFWGGADYVTLEGLEIANASFDGISLYAETSHGIAQDPIIDRCRIHDCNGPAVTIYGNSAQPANTLVQNCVMWSCLKTGGGAFGTTGRFGYVCTRRSNGTRIVHNTFYADTLPNSASYAVIGAYPSSASEIPFVEVSNNVVVKLASTLAPVFRVNSVAGSAFQVPQLCDSNCFLEASGSPFAIWGNPLTTAPTLLDWQVGALADLNSIQGDPLLRDPGNGDFHLTVGPGGVSPCIAASTVATNVTIDADGQTRSAPFDIGADEFGASHFSSVGTGCAGTGGLAPQLELYSWPYLGGDLAVGCERMPANTFFVLFGSLGLGAGPLPIGAGCSAYLDLGSFAAVAAAPSGPAGTASVVLPVPANPAFVGFGIAYQAIALDAGAPLGLTTSNAIDIVFDF